jgi:hypothetical protein
LRIFSRLLQTPAQKIAASAMMRTACSMGAAVRPKGPNGGFVAWMLVSEDRGGSVCLDSFSGFISGIPAGVEK